MKRSWTALVVALVAILALAGCNDFGNTFQPNTGASINFLSPSNISAGSPDFTLTVNGVGFVAKTVVQWNGKTIPTTVSTDANGSVLSVTATVSASLVAKAGTAVVNTLNPFSRTGDNGLSNPITFNINPPPNPIPSLASVSPNSVVAGAAAPLNITLTGANFLSNSDPTQASKVVWTMNQQQTTLTTGTITSTQIQATVQVSLLSTAGSASLTVFNPPSPPPPGCTIACSGGGGGGTTTPVPFTICPATGCPAPVTAGASAASLVAEETPAVSLDGRYVAYTAVRNDRAQVFLRDTCESAPAGCQPRTTLLSAAADGTAANEESHVPSMSSDGRYVAFSSAATNLVENAPPGKQIYLRDTCAGAGDSCKPSIQLVSTDSNGLLVGTESILPSVSSSGRFVAFLAVTPSHDSNPLSPQARALAGASNSGYRQVFIRDTCLGAADCTPKTMRVSLQPGDGLATDGKPAGPALSGDANHVAVPGFGSAALFTRSVAVDDRVFLAITGAQH